MKFLSVLFVVAAGIFPSSLVAVESFVLQRTHLFGTWKFVSAESSGKSTAVKRLARRFVEITPDELILNIRAGKFVMSYTLDSKKVPTGLTCRITRSPYGAGTEVKGIIALKNGRLKICYAHEGKVPTEFSSNFEEADRLLVMQPKLDQRQLEGEWVWDFGESDGVPIRCLSGRQSMLVTKDTWTLCEGDREFVMSYEVDRSVTPFGLKFLRKESPLGGKRRVARGIVATAAGQLFVCYTQGDRVPRKFEAKEGSNCRYLRLRRPSKGDPRDDTDAGGFLGSPFEGIINFSNESAFPVGEEYFPCDIP